MDTDDSNIRIQILEAKEDTGSAGRAVAIARERRAELSAVGCSEGAEALLVCPAPEVFVSEGVDLVVAARFGEELDDDTVFWRQHTLADRIHHELQLKALVVDLDGSRGFVRQIEPMLAVPYRDEIGARNPGV
jgi:hypothetical protein